jgi:hypothetical protein
MGNINGDSDILYELIYRNYKSGCLKTNTNINVQNISENTVKIINKIIGDLKDIEPKDKKEIRFSDVTYNKVPVFDNKTNVLTSYEYVPIFVHGERKGNPNEYVKRFKKLDINNLPLIEIAKYLNIKVEKSNNIESFGKYNFAEHKIVVGCDYEPTFVHELVHAIDHILPNFEYDLCYNELIAEFTTIVLCKTYNIPIDIPYSLYYLDTYGNSEENIHKAINRVALIYETIKECIKNIKSKNNGA